MGATSVSEGGAAAYLGRPASHSSHRVCSNFGTLDPVDGFLLRTAGFAETGSSTRDGTALADSSKSGALRKEIDAMTLCKGLVAGLAFGLAAIGVSGSASAVPATAGQSAISDLRGEIRSEGDVIRVATQWDRRRHGDRKRGRSGKYRYYHGGYYYATPWWQVGMVPGVVIGVPTPWSPAWFSYCERKYPRFNRRTGRYYHKGSWVVCR
jgi:hypothetical protein